MDLPPPLDAERVNSLVRSTAGKVRKISGVKDENSSYLQTLGVMGNCGLGWDCEPE
jgi:hypothetical protein